MCAMRDMLAEYWQENEVLVHYNLFHFLFECAITVHAELRQAWQTVPFLLSGRLGFPRKLQDALSGGLSERCFHELCSRTPVHKMSWKLDDAALAEARKLQGLIRI